MNTLTALLLAILPLAAANPDSPGPPVTSIAFSPDGTQLLTGSQSGITVLSVATLQPTHTIDTELEHVHDLEFSSSGQLLAAAGGSPSVAGEVEVYRWPSRERVWSAYCHDDLIYAVAWKDENELATAAGDHDVKLHRLSEKDSRRFVGHSRRALDVNFLPDGQLSSCAVDHSIRIWNTNTGELIRTLDNHTGPVRALGLRPARNGGLPMIASASSDKTVRFWQPTIGRLVRFAQLPSEPLSLAWIRDGDLLAATCVDGHVRTIDPDTAEVVSDAPAVSGWAYSLVASPDGKRIAVGGEQGQIRVLELDHIPLK